MLQKIVLIKQIEDIPTSQPHFGGMVRPKASETNLVAAVTFADILIVREQTYRSNTSFDRVFCKGSGSLYHAFHALLPELTRDSLDKNPENRQGVSMIELNKALKMTGLKSARKRDRTEDGEKRRCKVRPIFNTPFLLDLCSHL